VPLVFNLREEIHSKMITLPDVQHLSTIGLVSHEPVELGYDIKADEEIRLSYANTDLIAPVKYRVFCISVITFTRAGLELFPLSGATSIHR
jgi:hypothetical protein